MVNIEVYKDTFALIVVKLFLQIDDQVGYKKLSFMIILIYRYTLSQLSKKYSHSRQWIQEKIHTFIPNINQREGYKVTVVIDATFFGKGYDKFGLIIAKV